MGEFALIDRIRRVAEAGEGVALGIGDDAAVLELPEGCVLVATTDTLNEDVHFPRSAPAGLVGHKSLAANLSDLAAMGALPRWLLLNLSLETFDEEWVDGFLEGFFELAKTHGASLVGGDITRGSRSVTVTALGVSRQGKVLTRAGARPGDLVVVSGRLGTAAWALARLQEGGQDEAGLMETLHRATPRVGLGRALVGEATACIDISDGLYSDLGHIATASGVGAVVEVANLPAIPQVSRLDEKTRWRLQLSGGDDYELCFAWPPECESALDAVSERTGVDLTVVGRITRGSGIRCLDTQGNAFDPGRGGYEHFAAHEDDHE